MLNIGGYGTYNYYDAYKASAAYGNGNNRSGELQGSQINPANANQADSVKGINNKDTTAGKTNAPEKCETCENRKYQDGSNENVSFKAASHISREAAPAAVRAHEGEHVANAYEKAAKDDGKVLQASVRIHTSICPDCGRPYVSGGTTHTKIQYSNESNPYQQNQKASDYAGLIGQNINIAC